MVFKKGETFVALTPISKNIDFCPQSVYNVFPLILLGARESKELYSEMKLLSWELMDITTKGLNINNKTLKKIQFVWASDLSTFWQITKNKSCNPKQKDCQFCPYCTTTWATRSSCSKKDDTWMTLVECFKQKIH